MTLTGKNRNTGRKTFPSVSFFYHKSHMDWTGSEIIFPPARKATKHMRHGREKKIYAKWLARNTGIHVPNYMLCWFNYTVIETRNENAHYRRVVVSFYQQVSFFIHFNNFFFKFSRECHLKFSRLTSLCSFFAQVT